MGNALYRKRKHIDGNAAILDLVSSDNFRRKFAAYQINLDPHQPQEGVAVVPDSLGLPPSFTVHDLLTDERFVWRIGHNFVAFVPGVRQAHVLRVER